MGVAVKEAKRQLTGAGKTKFFDVFYNGKFIDSVPRGQIKNVKARIKQEELRNKRMSGKKWNL